MESYNSQDKLRKMWGVKSGQGIIKIQTARKKDPVSLKPAVFYTAILSQEILGRDVLRILGRCDNLGRPFSQAKKEPASSN